jgi:hypothetical protein
MREKLQEKEKAEKMDAAKEEDDSAGLVVPCLALPCLALPCLALPCLALPCLALPCLALPAGCGVVWSSRFFSSRLFFCLVFLSCLFALSSLVFSSLAQGKSYKHVGGKKKFKRKTEGGKSGSEGGDGKGPMGDFPMPEAALAFFIFLWFMSQTVELNRAKEISWQEFCTSVLETGDVEKIVIVNKSRAQVFSLKFPARPPEP